MKCFSGSCYRRSRSVESDRAPSQPSEACRSTEPRQRRRLTGSRSMPAASKQWHPGLTAISEDVVPPIVDRKGTERFRKKSESKRESINSYYQFREADDYNHRPNSMSMVMPMFSPTPFMF